MTLIIASYITDLVIGDPEWFPHPVRMMGKLIGLLDRRLRGKSVFWMERIKGFVLALIVVGISTYTAYLFIEFSKKLSPLLGSLAWVYLGYTTLSIKDLRVKAKAVLSEVKKGSIINARSELSKIVGRETENLTEEGVIKAATESIAESTSDGIVAPLFYLILGGPILAISYKAVNTLDSMVGHKNEKYMHFGWFSARLDDIMNFVPARISGFLISIASVFVRHEVPKQSQKEIVSSSAFGGLPAMTNAFKIMLRDGKKHFSPNSGIPEAAMAGALGIRLGGPSAYEGKLSEKPYIGSDKRQALPLLMNDALAISLLSSFFMILLGVLLKWPL